MRFNFKLLLLIVISLFSIFSCKSGPRDGDYSIYIFSTNDLHGRLFDSLYVPSQEQSTHKYSLASVSGYINRMRDSVGENRVVLLDAGDNLQGDNSMFYYNFVDTSSVHLFSRVMNYLNYDAITVGNHDIEAGPRVYNKITQELNAPFLAANAINLSNKEPHFEPYTIIERDGIKIAVIGLTNPNIPKWLSPELWEGLFFDQIVTSLNHWVEIVKKKERPHFIVALLHAGIGEIEEYNVEYPSLFVAKNVDGIDIVFASHDHKRGAFKVNNGKKDVWVLQGGSRASDLSSVLLNFSIKGGKVSNLTYDASVVPMSNIEPDRAYLDYFRSDFEAIREFSNREVGTLSQSISSRDCYFGQSKFLSLIHRVQLQNSDAQISFAAPLTYDVTINEGKLIYQDLFKLYPYENQLYVVEMSGREIVDYLEYSYSKWINKVEVSNKSVSKGTLFNISNDSGRYRFNNIHFNFDSAAGIDYEVDVTKDFGFRINIKSLSDGTQFDINGIYRVAMTSYRANGGGDILVEGAKIPKQMLAQRVVNRGGDIRDLIYTSLSKDSVIAVQNYNNWSFVPKNIANKMIKKERALLFPNE